MSRAGQVKYPFAIRTLEERVALEQSYLPMFKAKLGQALKIIAEQAREDAIDEELASERMLESHSFRELPARPVNSKELSYAKITIEWANKNIESCEYRIAELQESIIHIKSTIFMSERSSRMCMWQYQRKLRKSKHGKK